MFDFIPDAATMVKYTIACLVLFITPGPDMSFQLARTMSGGRPAGLAALLGASTGCFVHTILAALGLSLLIATSPTAFTIMKTVGALYLIWLAIGAIRQGSALNVNERAVTRSSFLKIFLTGVGVNLSNPKVVLFFITFLPLFVASDDPHASGKLIFLGMFFVVMSIVLGSLMILVAERLVVTLKARPKVMRIIDYVFAGVFGAFAASILSAQGK